MSDFSQSLRRCKADNRSKLPSILDFLTDDQMEALQFLDKAESESPTVSERLGQMMAELSKGNESVQDAIHEAKKSTQETFAGMLATPLYVLAAQKDNHAFDGVEYPV